MDRGLFARWFTALVFCIGAWWSFAGHLDPILDWAARHPLGSRAETYLDSSLRRATVGFTTVSAIKGGLAVIEGSELSASLGVGASIQAGDVIQPIYDYVDLAWRTLFTAAATLLGLKVLLATALRFAAIVVGSALVVAAIAVVSPRQRWLGRYHRRTADLLRALIVALLVFVYVLPGSILAASKLSSAITQSLLDEAQGELESVQQVLAPVSASGGGWLERMREARDALSRLVDQLRDRGEALFRATLRLIVGYLFDCVVFPLGLTLLGVRLARWLVGYTLTESRWDRLVAARSPERWESLRA